MKYVFNTNFVDYTFNYDITLNAIATLFAQNYAGIIGSSLSTMYLSRRTILKPMKHYNTMTNLKMTGRYLLIIVIDTASSVMKQSVRE